MNLDRTVVFTLFYSLMRMSPFLRSRRGSTACPWGTLLRPRSLTRGERWVVRRSRRARATSVCGSVPRVVSGSFDAATSLRQSPSVQQPLDATPLRTNSRVPPSGQELLHLLSSNGPLQRSLPASLQATIAAHWPTTGCTEGTCSVTGSPSCGVLLNARSWRITRREKKPCRTHR